MIDMSDDDLIGGVPLQAINSDIAHADLPLVAQAQQIEGAASGMGGPSWGDPVYDFTIGGLVYPMRSGRNVPPDAPPPQK